MCPLARKTPCPPWQSEGEAAPVLALIKFYPHAIPRSRTLWPISRIDFDLVLLYSASLENCFVEVMEAKQFLLLDSSTCSTHLPAKRNSILVLSFFFQRRRRSLKENEAGERRGRMENGWRTVEKVYRFSPNYSLHWLRKRLFLIYQRYMYISTRSSCGIVRLDLWKVSFKARRRK